MTLDEFFGEHDAARAWLIDAWVLTG